VCCLSDNLLLVWVIECAAGGFVLCVGQFLVGLGE